MNIETLTSTGHKHNSEAAPITRLSCVLCLLYSKNMSFTNSLLLLAKREKISGKHVELDGKKEGKRENET